MVKYNLKIIFAGRFIWFLLAAFLFFAYFMFQIAGYWKSFSASPTINIRYGVSVY